MVPRGPADGMCRWAGRRAERGRGHTKAFGSGDGRGGRAVSRPGPAGQAGWCRKARVGPWGLRCLLGIQVESPGGRGTGQSGVEAQVGM